MKSVIKREGWTDHDVIIIVIKGVIDIFLYSRGQCFNYTVVDVFLLSLYLYLYWLLPIYKSEKVFIRFFSLLSVGKVDLSFSVPYVNSLCKTRGHNVVLNR